MKVTPKKQVIAIVGPTASGKSELAVKIAKKLNGEIISADSRQIYKGMDIGSGKVEGKWIKFTAGSRTNSKKKVFLYKNIPHYLIDEASPRVQYSVVQFQKKAKKVLEDIFTRGKVPIICGGTAQWIDVLIMEQTLPIVPPNFKIRAQLEKLSTEQMFAMLKKLDPKRASEIDAKNPRRLIRALEIVMSTGKPVPKLITPNIKDSQFKISWIGLNPEPKTLEQRIKKRLSERLKRGMVKEVQKLHKQGVSWKRMESFGLEYKFCALFLQKKLTKTEFELQLFTAIRQYTKRQMTWWKRNKNIRWYADASKVVNDFY